MFCKQICQIFQAMTKGKIHYPGLLVQYSMSNSKIESLNIGTIMLGDLEKLAGLSWNLDITSFKILIWKMLYTI